MQNPNKSRAAPLASLAVLVFAAWQGIGTLMATPAFNQHLQIEGAGGTTRPILTRSMYDRAEYLYQTAYAYAHFTAQALLSGADISSLSVESMKANNLSALTYAEQSLRHNPTNAHAWMILATTRRAASQNAEAQKAFEIASELAPYSTALAFPRLLFVAGDRSGNAPSETVRKIVERDLSVLETHKHATFQIIQKRYPDLIAMTANAPDAPTE